MILPDFSFERKALAHGATIVGIDEAGRGPLAGPVVAAAARYRGASFEIPNEDLSEFLLIRDSKALSEKNRERSFCVVRKYFDIGVGQVDAETIDRVNILGATFLAMRSAISNLVRLLSERGVSGGEDRISLLVDGNREIPGLEERFSQEAIVRGDSRSISIAAASIVAKVTRDRLMRDLDREYPLFGFARHKGYGTEAHLEALRLHGTTPAHRNSFAPVARASRQFAKKKKS